MGDRLMITVEHSARALSPLKQYLAEAGLTDIAIKEAEPGLEDVFVQVINRAEGERVEEWKGRE